MIPNKNRRSRPQMLLALHHKLHSRRQPHCPFKRPRYRVLAESTISDDSQGKRCHDAIGGAEDQAAEGESGARVEGESVGFGSVMGEHDPGDEEEGEGGEEGDGHRTGTWDLERWRAGWRGVEEGCL